VSTKPREFSQSFFHGTKADLKLGDQIIAGCNSNYEEGTKAKYVYLTANLSAAVWGAELAIGEGRGRIYVVEPTGLLEDDPNLTDKKYPGNPTNSYRTRDPLRVVGEVIDWQEHSTEETKLRKENLARLLQKGAKIIEE
jgi:rifampin ADP-ribosylating transferase